MAQLRELVETLSELVAQHVRLARLELAQNARYVGVRVGLIAALAPLILVGYGFMCVALALTLRRIMPPDAAFLLVGLLNLAVGLIGIGKIANQLKGQQVLHVTLSELESTTSLVRQEPPK